MFHVSEMRVLTEKSGALGERLRPVCLLSVGSLRLNKLTSLIFAHVHLGVNFSCVGQNLLDKLLIVCGRQTVATRTMQLWHLLALLP